MDPSTTLFTFLFETDPSVRSVQLLGSWDNFSTCYTMRRDLRRGQDQWRGCYSFKDIVREDSSTPQKRRTGGLKMGHTYFYYYEIDGSTETYDPSMPSTTACPYLPGQTVNTLTVPIERTLRYRSASMGSVRQEDYKTMNPEAKFSNPNPVPTTPSRPSNQRASSASFPRSCSPPSRSGSPAPSWRRLFERKRGRSNESVPQKKQFTSWFDADEPTSALSTRENRSAATSTTTLISSRSSRQTRDISPETLHRFLCEDTESRSGSASTARPSLRIPDEVDDDIDADESDDDNFAASAVSENQSFFTRLSPPPFQRSSSPEMGPLTLSSATAPATAPGRSLSPVEEAAELSSKSLSSSGSRWSLSLASGLSPTADEEPLPLYEHNDLNDSEDTDDNDEHSSLAGRMDPRASLHRQDTFRGYRLPRIGEEAQKAETPVQRLGGFDHPKRIARRSSETSDPPNYLGGQIDTGLDDFVNEMGWIVDVIGTDGDY